MGGSKPHTAVTGHEKGTGALRRRLVDRQTVGGQNPKAAPWANACNIRPPGEQTHGTVEKPGLSCSDQYLTPLRADGSGESQRSGKRHSAQSGGRNHPFGEQRPVLALQPEAASDPGLDPGDCRTYQLDPGCSAPRKARSVTSGSA